MRLEFLPLFFVRVRATELGQLMETDEAAARPRRTSASDMLVWVTPHELPKHKNDHRQFIKKGSGLVGYCVKSFTKVFLLKVLIAYVTTL